MNYAEPNSLEDTQGLLEHLTDNNLRIIDGTSYLPGMSDRTPYEDFKGSHIPGAVYFDINRIADENNILPHMLPSPQVFSLEVGRLGISPSNRVVVYDRNGGYMAACRVWWMFRLFGFKDIAVLNGGFPAWREANLPVENGDINVHQQTYEVTKNPALIRSFEDVLTNIETKNELVVDARSEGRFSGDEDEPRPGLSRGHIPGSINLPFGKLMNPGRNFEFRNSDEIIQTFLDHGLEDDKPVITTCGSGVTACVIAFAMHLVGYKGYSVYDGSWADWGSNRNAPIETGK